MRPGCGRGLAPRHGLTVAIQSVPIPSGAAERWARAVPLRRSRRSYTAEAVPAHDLAALEELGRSWAPWPGVRVVVLREAPPAVFVGILGAYGGISGAPSALVFIGGPGARGEAVGHLGEAFVLEAAARGLDTCWVGGLYSKHALESLVALEGGERIHAIAALGHAAEHTTVKERLLFGAARAKHRRPAEEIAPGCGAWPEWARAAMEAVRLAPSAMNGQPWRFAMDGDALDLTFAGADRPRTSKRVDCGIAMLHVEVAAAVAGVAGRWEILDAPEVARFVYKPGATA